jgi:type IV secretory pathway TraG/TraD family ATPase VirD4
VLGFQSIAQVSSTYGKGEAQTLVENCGNSLILRCSASEHGGTSQFASRLIGQREVVHISHSRSRRPSDAAPSITESEHRQIEPAVMDSEIERLPDLAGFLKLASSPDWLRVKLCWPERIPDKPAAAEQSVAVRPRSDPASEHAREASRGREPSRERDDTSSLDQGWEHE